VPSKLSCSSQSASPHSKLEWLKKVVTPALGAESVLITEKKALKEPLLPRGYNILNLLQILFFPDSRIPKTKLK
jgi:hypothetical protein